MKKIRVADINVLIKYAHPTMVKQAEAYLCDFEKEDIRINIPDEELERLQSENSHLSIDDVEYIFTGAAFYESIINFNGFLLHSSGVCVNGWAYLFSADSGTGKSTHTGLWQKYLGEDKAKIINDDKPAIRIVDGKNYVYGTPWSGKTDQNLNLRMPLGGIVFLERSTENFIHPITSQEAIPKLFQQTLRPREPERMAKLLDVLDKVLSETPIYRLGCDMSKEAVELSFNTIRRDK
ncbi:MAG: hypothetical protein IJR59_01545 [Firmicutes bacterium]|nr:hypothetical protein [Bacillota bacterium]